jgi:hypothetical protein
MLCRLQAAKAQAEALRRYVIGNIDFGPEMLCKKRVHRVKEEGQVVPLRASNPTVAF